MAFLSRHHKASHGEDLRTRTPQGDGNFVSFDDNPQRREEFKNQNPARGRKLVKDIKFRVSYNNLRTRTPQGDGNIIYQKCLVHLINSFKNQNPARGRKLLHLSIGLR